jgi:ABC-type lipoprotein release transport system permease subunit
MLPILSWRNVWRNRLRSLVVILAIALGLWGGLFMMAFSWGMSEQRTRDIIDTQTSHVQVHHPEFKDEQRLSLTVPQGDSLAAQLRARPDVEAAAARMVLTGMLATASDAAGVQVFGVEPEAEAALTRLRDRVTYGEYFPADKRYPVLIGEQLAEKLGILEGSGDSASVNFRERLVLTFQAEDSTLSARFRICGIYKAQNSRLEELQVFALKQDLESLIGAGSMTHELAVKTRDITQADSLVQELRGLMPDMRTETWAELAPDINLIAESFEVSMRIFFVIILLALAFGIINTMLMAVMERTRELGMLMAVGMGKLRVFGMIMLETLYLALVGGPLGVLLAWITITWTSHTGISLIGFGEAGAAVYGMSAVVYPSIQPGYYLEISIMVLITAGLSALYPALRALRLRPVEAIRSH